MKSARLLLLLVLLACRIGEDAAYTRPSAKFGAEDPALGSGTTRSISAKFSAADLQVLYGHLNSPEFQRRLGAYMCGDPPPRIAFTVSIFEPAEYQERHVLIQPRPEPSPSGRERCLDFGLGYEIDREIEAIDHGEPINYHYHDPHTGKELPSTVYKRQPLRQPTCNCAKKDSQEEWVTFPEATDTK